MKKKICGSLIAAGLTMGSSYAALQISGLNTPQVITFDQSIGYDGDSDSNQANDVMKVYNYGNTNPDISYSRILEHGNAQWLASDHTVHLNVGVSAEAWAYQHSNTNFGGLGSGVRTHFGDYNNNASIADRTGYLTMFNLGEYFGEAGQFGYVLGSPSGSALNSTLGVTLRIQNSTGVTVDAWDIGLDVWMKDVDTALSNFTISYSTNDVDYTTLDVFTGADTSGAWTQFDDTEFNSVSASVDDGGYLYVQFFSERVSGGTGTAFGIDNISVTAVPEPSTYAMISGLVLFAFAAVRRRKTK